MLGAQPSATVTVTIGTSPQCSVSPTSLTFNTSNWSNPRTVTLAPFNDAVVEGPHSCAPASITASGGGYSGVTATPPTINITDNDVGTITLVATDNAATESPGDTGAFTIVLGAQPSATVTVTIGTSPQCNFASASLTFTTANWNTVQTVVATPIDDAVAEGAHSCSPSAVSAVNGGYDGVGSTPPTINIADNDIAGITVTGGPLTVTEGVGGDLHGCPDLAAIRRCERAAGNLEPGRGDGVASLTDLHRDDLERGTDGDGDRRRRRD